MSQQNITVERATSLSLIQDPTALSNMDQFAQYMASGQLMTPAQFRNRPADCFMITVQAAQWGMNPLAVATQVYDVHGNLAYSAQLIVAIILQSGMVENRPYFEPVGDWSKKGKLLGNRFENEDGLGVRVGFKFKGDNQVTFNETVYLSEQTVRNSPLYKTNPYQQLCYVGAKYWARLYMPGAAMGLYSEDEERSDNINKTAPVEHDITPKMEPQDVKVDFEATPAKSEEEISQVVEEVIEEIIADPALNPEEAEAQEKVNALNESEVQKEEVKVDSKGVVFNPEIHTGTILKTTGEWRLNRLGKELKEKEEQAKKLAEESNDKSAEILPETQEKSPTETAEKVTAEQFEYVKAIHNDSIGMLGSSPVKVEGRNKEKNAVKIGDNWLPISNESGTYLMFCNEDGSALGKQIEEIDNPFEPIN